MRGPAGTPAGPGVRGELCVRGHSTMLSYLHDAGATAAAIDGDGWLRTGDEGFYERDGDVSRFFVTGRIKEIIIRGGEKLSPLAIERKLAAAMPELEGRLAVLGFAHEAHGEEVGAYVCRDGLPVDEVRLRAALDRLPLEQRPKVVLLGTAPVPRTHTGKVQRRKLQPLFHGHVRVRGPVRVEALDGPPPAAHPAA